MDEIPRKYSERLGVIAAAELQSAADAAGLGKVLDAEPAAGGLFGQNIILTTSSGGFVLRGNPHGHVQLTKERCVARFINERSSLPVPWPYEVFDETETFGWTYAIMPLLPGTSGQSLRESADDAVRIVLARAAGSALARLHEATADMPGPYDAQMDGWIEMDDFKDWVLHRLEHWRTLCRAVNALSTDAEVYIDEVIGSCSDALEEPFTPVLVHHDFSPGNINFEETRSGFEPSGVFDLFEAYIADGEEDLVRMIRMLDHPEERTAFLDSYTAHNPLRPGAADRLALYALADWLVIWEYGRRNGIWFEDATFVETARPIVANARAVASSGR